MSGIPPERRALVDLTLIALFLGAIVAPTIDRMVRPDDVRGPLREGHVAAPKPAFPRSAAALDSFPQRFEAWFKDSFGLRDKLLRWNSILKLEILGISPTAKVVLGKDDSLLYAESHTFEVWRGVDPFSAEELEAWRHMLEHNRDRLRQRGIEYVFAIGPNKETIYPERVPDRFNRIGPTRLDQLIAYLESHSDFRILDMRPALFAAKKDDTPGNELYFRDGTHWSARGSVCAYRDLVADLARFEPKLSPLDASRIEISAVAGPGDSWRSKMLVDDRNPQGVYAWKILPEPTFRTVLAEGPTVTDRTKATELLGAPSPHVLLFHDSFATYFEDLFAETVGRLVCRGTTKFDSRELDRARPSVVVELFVERILVTAKPDQLEMKSFPSDREAYEASKEIVYTLTDMAEITAWNAATCRVVTDAGATAVEATYHNWKGLALLPELAAEGSTVLFADVTSDVSTSLLLFFQLDAGDAYLRRRSVWVPLEAGRNRVHVRLDETKVRGRLGLRPGSPEGKLLFHGIEIHRVPTVVDADRHP